MGGLRPEVSCLFVDRRMFFGFDQARCGSLLLLYLIVILRWWRYVLCFVGFLVLPQSAMIVSADSGTDFNLPLNQYLGILRPTPPP